MESNLKLCTHSYGDSAQAIGANVESLSGIESIACLCICWEL